MDFTFPLTPPFLHLNLHRNPFGEIDRITWAELAVVEVEQFAARLSQPRFALQVVGEKGRGKTTHLLAIWRQFPQSPYVYIGEGQRPPIPHGAPLFIDEAQRLSPWRRWRVFGRGVPLVLATHDDHARELTRAGYQVETLALDGRLQTTTLETILNRRIEWFRRGPGQVPCIGRAAVERLLARHGDDVRAIEFELYERFQQLKEPGNVEV